ncbi:hypothetical protein [Paenibacillus sp. ATY16]|uniref:hypothetical protein n=1 Tax=Paenibacillus sp. ATY16 TaxID=1759312 RepID=UPI00200C2F27|nr:hypothetical protein [Paenibacillus sp. ATY16]MCK9861011.1 hypothetical protein [Paenibacillus sp. ATY16]
MDGELEEMMDEYDEEEASLFEGYMKQNPDAEAFKVFGINNERRIKSMEGLLAGNLGFNDEDLSR